MSPSRAPDFVTDCWAAGIPREEAFLSLRNSLVPAATRNEPEVRVLSRIMQHLVDTLYDRLDALARRTP